MTEELKQRILQLAPHKPYVWRLKLTKNEYDELADYVKAGSNVINRDYARLAIAYIAEWYKRDYDGNVANPLDNVAAESLWKASGFDSETLVYTAKSTRRHLESIYMLGGLPMRFIRQGNKRNLLKALCRIYKGDKASLDGDKQIGRGEAKAFQESIQREASLYEFLKALLLKGENEVYSSADLSSKSSLASRFVEEIKSAYDEVMRDKFRLEWIIDNNPSSPYMRRMLRLWLRPEELGGLHQYLRFDRARSWNIPSLMNQRKIKISLEFYDGQTLVGDENTRRPLIYFENSGQEDTGFEATGAVPWAILRSLPTQKFDKIKLIATDDADKRHELPQKFECKQQYMQLWSMKDEPLRWSSTRNNQSESAVVYSKHYTLTGAEAISKPFFDKTNGTSEPWNFALIEDHVKLQHKGDADITLWNRDGYIQFAPKLYTNVLRYKAGKVRYMYNEDPDIYSEAEGEEWYPAVFKLSDIKAYHFATKDLVNTKPDEVDIQEVEFKKFSDPNEKEYVHWSEDEKPPYGRLKLRLTIKDEKKVFTILHLPSMLERGFETPVVRNTTDNKLQYVDVNGDVVDMHVNIPMDKQPLDITQPLTVWGNDEEYVQLDAITPTLIKEVYLDGVITKYIQNGEEFILPYLLRNRVAIHDFNVDGYAEYECFNIGVLRERGSIQKWKQSLPLETVDVLAKIPDYIRVAYGIPQNPGTISHMLYWDYCPDKQPEEVDANFSNMGGKSILFQDMRKVNDDLDCVPPVTCNEWVISDDDWERDEEPTENNTQEITLLRCYDVATMYKTYYFIFNPLYNITQEEFISGICIPLKKRGSNSLTEEDVQNLMRCATECGLNWDKLSTRI